MEKLQCSVCGGTLVMSDDGEKAVCESCGMSFKKETVKKMIMELSERPIQNTAGRTAARQGTMTCSPSACMSSSSASRGW